MPISSKDVPSKSKADEPSKPKADEPKVEEPKSTVAAAPVAKTPDKAAVYVANQTGVTNIDGAMFQFRAGVTHVSADDPAYKSHPELFNAVEGRARPAVETATAAPGETR